MISAALLCSWVPTPRTLLSSPSLCLATCSSQGRGLHRLGPPSGPASPWSKGAEWTVWTQEEP